MFVPYNSNKRLPLQQQRFQKFLLVQEIDIPSTFHLFQQPKRYKKKKENLKKDLFISFYSQFLFSFSQGKATGLFSSQVCFYLWFVCFFFFFFLFFPLYREVLYAVEKYKTVVIVGQTGYFFSFSFLIFFLIFFPPSFSYLLILFSSFLSSFLSLFFFHLSFLLTSK